MTAHLPAFPVPLNSGQSYKGHSPCDGLTKREMLSAMAMQGLLAGEYRNASPSKYGHVAEHAVSHADALLKALEKQP